METAASKSKNCKVEGCKRPYRAKGYCNTHFKKWRAGEMPKKARYKTCSGENCRKPLFRFGLCETHYAGLLKGQEVLKEEAPKEEPKKEEPKKEAQPEKTDEKKE
ncbi:MAG: hypothetical protein HY466_00025 [Deltaproteobacteria bacterium]|nr:hypothetical protein [Deltaproteobacteria bacterium]